MSAHGRNAPEDVRERVERREMRALSPGTELHAAASPGALHAGLSKMVNPAPERTRAERTLAAECDTISARMRQASRTPREVPNARLARPCPSLRPAERFAAWKGETQ